MSLAKDDKIETAYEIIKVVYDANIFYHSQAFMFRLHIAWSSKASYYPVLEERHSPLY